MRPNQLMNLLGELYYDVEDLEGLKLLSICLHDLAVQLHEFLAVSSRNIIEEHLPFFDVLSCPHGEILPTFLAHDSAFAFCPPVSGLVSGEGKHLDLGTLVVVVPSY